MQEFPQGPTTGQPINQSGRRAPGVLDPHRYDPRKAMDSQQMQRLARAQAIARAKAQATSTVFLATVVSLATSAFGVVAAFAWNTAIEDNLKDLVNGTSFIARAKLTAHQAEILYAVLITLIAVVVILLLNRVASRIAKQSAIDAAEADSGNV